MKIIELHEKGYEEREKDFACFTFLQSYLWGEVMKSLGYKVFRLGFFENENLIGLAQLISVKARRGRFLKIEHGPLFESENYFWKMMESILLWIKENKLHKNHLYLRITPNLEYSEERVQKMKSLGFKMAPRWLVSESFWVKRINVDEESLLKEMSSHHRKLISDSLKKPYIEIKTGDDFEAFWKIYQDISLRKDFVPYPYELVKKEFEIFKSKNMAELYFGIVEGKVLSSALIIFYKDSAYYHHGGSIPSKEPVNYKLHWKIILDAKNRGCKFYNFWGILPRSFYKDLPPNHPWQGFSKFKIGFGGKLIKTLPTFDYPFSLKYYPIKLYEKLSEKLRFINKFT
jgi:lipid II:glycine glycyltransferase (peptidoglycan interpeptide bridge formation enzyme)